MTTPLSPGSPPPLPARAQDSLHDHTHSEEEEEPESSGSKGIMKRSRSFENLRNPERKVTFDGETPPGSCTPSSSPSPTSHLEDSVEGEDNPVQVCVCVYVVITTAVILFDTSANS